MLTAAVIAPRSRNADTCSAIANRDVGLRLAGRRAEVWRRDHLRQADHRIVLTGGSWVKTSKAAPATCPTLIASATACSSSDAATRAVHDADTWLHLRDRRRVDQRLRVSLVSGTCTVTKWSVRTARRG